MPTYAVKIGDIMLNAERPITDEDRRQATEMLKKAGYKFHVGTSDLDVVLRTSAVDRH